MNPEKYKGIVGGFRTTIAEEGARGLAKGWAPTLVGKCTPRRVIDFATCRSILGYSLQGLGKFGFYEVKIDS